jgi:hypothetical protein
LDIGQDISIGYFLHRRPVRIGCAAFHIVNRLARELEWNAQFDKRFDIALAGLDPIARRLDLVEVTGADLPRARDPSGPAHRRPVAPPSGA